MQKCIKLVSSTSTRAVSGGPRLPFSWPGATPRRTRPGTSTTSLTPRIQIPKQKKTVIAQLAEQNAAKEFKITSSILAIWASSAWSCKTRNEYTPPFHTAYSRLPWNRSRDLTRHKQAFHQTTDCSNRSQLFQRLLRDETNTNHC